MKNQAIDDGTDYERQGECLTFGTGPTGEGGRHTAKHHAGEFAEGHKHGVVDDEAAHGHIAMQTVFEHITGHGIAESVEEVHAHANQGELDPRVCCGRDWQTA